MSEIPNATKSRSQDRELERLRKIYPLFKFEEDGLIENGSLSLVVETSFSAKSYMLISPRGTIGHESTLHLGHMHMEQTLGKELMELYPNLYIAAHAHKDGISIWVWVKRNERDAESVGDLKLISAHFHLCLAGWQEEAKKACQEGWFFCTGHGRAEAVEHLEFHHFAGRFCKQWGDEHPEILDRALRETYE